MNVPVTQLDRAAYEKLSKKYALLGENIRLSLTALLEQENIDIHQIQVRVKTFESFRNKMERKNYRSLEDMEDICGVRIICFYVGDVKKIHDLIAREFTLVGAENKTKEVPPEQFWYSSYHYVVTIKPEWLNIPDYRDLHNFKAEIQVRTILEHAWAEIEHKLTYKVFDAIPDELKRPFAQLSAVLDLADERFNQLREERRRYVEALREGQFDLSLPVNADTLKAFLYQYFPDQNDTSVDDLNMLVQQLREAHVSYADIVSSYEKVRPFLKDITREAQAISLQSFAGSSYTKTGMVRMTLALTHPHFYHNGEKQLPEELARFLKKWQPKIMRGRS